MPPQRATGRGTAFRRVWASAAALLLGCQTVSSERIAVSPDGRGFVEATSGRPFVPWGFNYDHDRDQRLIEDYWEAEWAAVEQDFREMKSLGASVVRVHLQLAKLLRGPDKADDRALAQLKKLLDLAERTGLLLDLTGLGCYRKSDVPAWYDALDEDGRWAAQAYFWKVVAGACASSPAVFCYDLMNEPVVPGGRREHGEWLGPPFAGLYHYVQFVTLDPAGRPRPQVARLWARRLAAAVREADPRALVTIGLVDWSIDRPGLTSGFVPREVAPEVDFLCVHLYPQAGKVGDAIETLRGFDVGKPVVIEETFPLGCSVPEFEEFLRRSAGVSAGWIGFYWGKTADECRRADTIGDSIFLQWLEVFSRGPPAAVPRESR